MAAVWVARNVTTTGAVTFEGINPPNCPPGQPTIVITHHRLDENGAIAVTWNKVGTFTAWLEGRMDDSAGWMSLEDLNQTLMTGPNLDAGEKTSKIFPQMRINVTAIAGGASITAYMME